MITRILSFFSLLLISLSPLSAQTTYTVEAGGGPNGPAPYYEPQFLTIQVGDIVEFSNVGGTHNVDGTTATFPTNPEGFTNGQPSNMLWSFSHTFTIAGEYQFECSAYDHNETQFGTITVEGTPDAIEEYEEVGLSIFPNPASDIIRLTAEMSIDEAVLYSSDMKEVKRFVIEGNEFSQDLTVTEMPNGMYFLYVRSDDKRLIRKVVID